MLKPLKKKSVSEDCFLILQVQKPNIPNRIHEEAQIRNLVEKDEFHISVAVTKNARKIKEVISRSSAPEKLWEEITTLFESCAWEYSLTDEYYLQENSYSEPRHTRRTIIQKVNLSDLLPFYEKLGQILGIIFPMPVPHITLLSWSDDPLFMTRGIGISSEEDFETYSQGRL